MDEILHPIKRVNTLYKRYGKDYFSKIGKLGAKRQHELYAIVPIGASGYLWIKRSELK